MKPFGLNLSVSGHEGVEGFCEYAYEPLGSIKHLDILQWLCNRQLLKDSVHMQYAYAAVESFCKYAYGPLGSIKYLDILQWLRNRQLLMGSVHMP
jgi:hypothetical protein